MAKITNKGKRTLHYVYLKQRASNLVYYWTLSVVIVYAVNLSFLLTQLRLRQDRLRQEQLARERLAQLRNRRKAKEAEAEEKLVTDGDVGVLQEAVVKALERKHQDERQVWTSFAILG